MSSVKLYINTVSLQCGFVLDDVRLMHKKTNKRLLTNCTHIPLLYGVNF